MSANEAASWPSDEADASAGSDGFGLQEQCSQHATMCELMAGDAEREANRKMLLSTAAQWRTLAKHAKS